jgi:hypothetical protein
MDRRLDIPGNMREMVLRRQEEYRMQQSLGFGIGKWSAWCRRLLEGGRKSLTSSHEPNIGCYQLIYS